jgi:hypothetical protein
MPVPKTTLPVAAEPNFGAHFDAWNSSSSGHQRAENRLGGSIGWRNSRSMKLSHQFKSGGTGGKRISDQIGAGSEDWDEKAKALIPKDVREMAKMSVRDMLIGKKKQETMAEEDLKAHKTKEGDLKKLAKTAHERKIFNELVVYVNGSTYPTVSDHKLKCLLAENGARVSIHLARRQVTHVILGKPIGSENTGAGGGLAASKIQKEIKRVGGCGVKYVGVEW